MKPDDKICFCYDVTLRKLVNYIRREHPPVASLMSQCLSAGTGCGWCVPFLQKLHQDVLAGKYDALDQLDAAEYEKLRTGWLEQLKPARDADRFAEQVLCGPPPAGTDQK